MQFWITRSNCAVTFMFAATFEPGYFISTKVFETVYLCFSHSVAFPPTSTSLCFFLLIFSPSSPAVSAVTNNSFEALNNLPLFITALEALSLAHSNGPGARCDPPMLDSSLWATFPLSVLMAFVSLSLSLTHAVCSQVIKISNLILNSLWIKPLRHSSAV